MTNIIVALFVLALIFISTAGREFEYQDSWEADTTVTISDFGQEQIARVLDGTFTNPPDVDIIFEEWLERTEQRHNGLTDEENKRLIDSLWQEIKWTH